MYGPSTLLVVTTGDGVHGFTLDRAGGAYVRTYTNLRIPARGRTYSVNDGNFTRWPDGVRRFVEHVRAIDVASGRPYTARYAGYECSPMGLIVEQAGGVASTGRARVLDLVPAAPHERVPLLIGSLEDVRLAEEFYAARRA